MRYILDTQAIYYCAGVYNYKTFDKNILYNDIKSGRELFISFYSLLEILTKPDLLNDDRKIVLNFIFEKELIIIPPYIEQPLSNKILSQYLNYFNFNIQEIEYSYINNGNKYTIGKCYKLRKLHFQNKKRIVKKHMKMQVPNIINYKGKIETIILNLYFHISYYLFFRFYFTLFATGNSSLIDKFKNEAERLLLEFTKDFYKKYNKKILQSYTHKNRKQRCLSIKELKNDLEFDIIYIHVLFARLLKKYDPTYDLYDYLMASKIFENEYINSAGIKKDINDFFDKATYKKLEPYEINELNSQNTGPDKIVFENLLKYLSELNYKQLYENRKIEKNDMFDSLFISYFPDFNIFTFDRKMRETFKNIAPILYTELNNFIQSH